MKTITKQQREQHYFDIKKLRQEGHSMRDIQRTLKLNNKLMYSILNEYDR